MNYLEAEYAFRLKKPIIPLLVEGKYTADGWLREVLRTKSCIEFTDKEQFENGMNKLIKEIHDRGKIGNEVIGPNNDFVDNGGTKCIYHLIFLSIGNGKAKIFLINLSGKKTSSESMIPVIYFLFEILQTE